MKYGIKAGFSAIATFLVYVLGGWDIALQSLLLFIVIDYITGMAKSYVTSKLNSNRGFKGIVKKLCMLFMVAVSVVIDQTTGETGLIRTMVIYYMVANEGLSILENLASMDILVPSFLKERLEQLRGDQDDKGIDSGK